MYLWSKTIWAKGAIPPTVDRDKRRLKKFYLPLLDIAFIIGGWTAAKYGVPALEDVFPDDIQDVFGIALSILGLAAFIGLAFNEKLWLLEIVAKWILVSTMAVYMGSLIFLVGGGGNSRAFVVVIAFIAMILVLFRLDMAANEWRERKLAAAVAAAKAGMEAGE